MEMQWTYLQKRQDSEGETRGDMKEIAGRLAKKNSHGRLKQTEDFRCPVASPDSEQWAGKHKQRVAILCGDKKDD